MHPAEKVSESQRFGHLFFIMQDHEREVEGMEPKITRREMLKKASMFAAAGMTIGTLLPIPNVQAANGLDRQVQNVKDFGAQGLGSRHQNDSPAFQRAINELSAKRGGTLYVPPGEYYLHQPLFIGSNITIMGDPNRSARLLTYYSHQTVLNVNASAENVHIQNIDFIGTGSTHGNRNSSFETAVSIKKAKNISIHHCSFTLLAAAIHIEESSNISVTHSEFYNMVGAKESAEGRSVVVLNSKDVTIENNRFLSGFREYIYLSQGASSVRVADNRFTTQENGAVTVDGREKACSEIQLLRNIIQEDPVPSKKEIPPKMLLQGAVTTCKVSDNTIRHASHQAIVLDGGSHESSRNLIAANWIMDAQFGIICKNSSNNMITNNVIDAVKEYGIAIDASGSKAASENNVVVHNVINQSGKAAVFIANEKCKNTQVQGNTGIGNKKDLVDNSVKQEKEKTT